MNKFGKIGIGLIILGIAMFFMGVSMFTYRGDLNPIISKIGEISFIFWLPTIFIGGILIVVNSILTRIKKGRK